MKAFAISRYGKNEQLQLTEMREPVLEDYDVLVRVHAAGVNHLDSRIRNGELKLILPYKMPLILGHDVAGVVAGLGPKANKFKIGDEVYGRPNADRIGTFAEYMAVNENDVARKPKHLSMEEAASIPLVGLTAWQALVEIAQLRRGQKVFIQAGSGGVGTIAIQLARSVGATVATTASQKSSELVQSLGADVVIDYRKDDFETRLSNYDVVLHSQDSRSLYKALRILKPGGKLISIAGPPTPEFAVDMGAPGFVQVALRALSYKARRRAKKLGVEYAFLFMKADGTQLGKITAMIEAGKVRPVMDRVFAFEQTNEAVAYVEGGHAKGKVVVRMGDK